MSQPASPGPAAPRQVGRYELTERHLPGAGAERWRGRVATGAELGRRISVRSIPRSEALTAQAVERLSNAGFAAMELRHPKIAAVLDVVVADSEVAIVSEDLAGISLQELLRPAEGQPRTQTPPEVAARMVLDVLDALSSVAEPWAEVVPPPETDEERVVLGALHGGVTPDTLLVATFGETLLLEPGISGAALTVAAIADHPEIIAFRAPEQLEPGRPVDERADLFTAGIVAWELVAGRSLFAAASLPRPAGAPAPLRASGPGQVASAKRRVLTAPILRLDGLPGMKGKVGKPFADWVARCLERDPAKRFPSLVAALDVLRALGPQALASHEAVAAFVAARAGAGAGDDAPPVSSGALESNRPTRPPVPEASAAADAAGPRGPSSDRPTHVDPLAPVAAGAGPAGAAVGAVAATPEADTSPPSAAEASVPSPARAEAITAVPERFEPVSVPPDSAEAVSVLPASADVSSVPPGGADVLSLPPESAEVISVVPSSAEVSSLPPDGPGGGGASESLLPDSLAESLPPGTSLPAPDAEAEGRRFPVARPFSDLPASPASEPPPDVSPALARRAQSRKIVLLVVAGAALLLLVALGASALRGGEGPERRATPGARDPGVAVPATAPPAQAEVAAPPGPPRPAAAPVPAEPAAAPAEPPAPAAAPADPAVPAAPAPRRAGKKPFRPTDI